MTTTTKPAAHTYIADPVWVSSKGPMTADQARAIIVKTFGAAEAERIYARARSAA